MIHDFYEKLQYSLGERENFDMDILKKMIPHCEKIEKTTVEVDKTGIDYVATLARGAKINIDAKTRVPGASKYWKYNEPELALEIWDKVPTPYRRGVTGWTLKTNSNVDYILYTFDKRDTNNVYFVPFQMLRTVFVNNFSNWKNKYKIKTENNTGWKSEAIFVPASVVCSEINKLMIVKVC